MEIVFLLVGLLLLALGGAVLRSEVQARRGREAVSARIIGFSTGREKPISLEVLRNLGRRQRDSTDGASTYAAVVEYSDHQGQNRTFVDSFSSNPPTYHTGELVNVLYDQDSPREAQIDRGRANNWAAILLGSFGGLFAALGLFSARKLSRQSS